MFGRFIRDESGMTMALTVVMIVLIGVMGAGILVFVQRDLESVVEVNNGQRAFELADAGVQLAKRQLLSDAFRQHYDTIYTNDCMDSTNRIGPDWSPTTTGYPNANCTGTPVTKQAGVTKTFAGGEFTVTIQCVNQTGDPLEGSSTDTCVGGGSTFTEPVSADVKRFFKVVSTGSYNGAKRRIEVIYNTRELGVPKGYYSPTKIDLGGSSCLRNVSVFSLGDISVNGGGCGGGDHVQGTDVAYGNWQNSFNSTPRLNTNAGLGAVGNIDDGAEVSGRDYDSDVPSSTYPKFIQDIPASGQTSTQITFPFDYKTVQAAADAERLEFYKEEALRQEALTGQDHYREISGTNPPLSTWPANSSYGTVVYVKLTDANPGTMNWDVGGPTDPDLPSPYPNNCKSPIRKGILVVENGNFTTQPVKALFSGSLIVRGGIVENGDYSDTGSTCFEGYVNANGEIKVNGSVNPSSTPDLARSPGFYRLQLWSWRELYK